MDWAREDVLGHSTAAWPEDRSGERNASEISPQLRERMREALVAAHARGEDGTDAALGVLATVLTGVPTPWITAGRDPIDN